MSRTAAVRATPLRAPAPRTGPTGSARAGSARAARPTARPELRLVPTGTSSRTRRRTGRALLSRKASFVLLVVALLSLTTVGLLVLNTAIAVDSLEASSRRQDNAARAQEIQRLEQQVVSGRTPAEVARAAQEIGLVPAGAAGYLVLGPGSTAMRGTPEPAPAPATAPAPAPAPSPAAEPEPAPAAVPNGD
ncbi:hypothetical protein DQ237_13930 [Blastococcus sp. TF02-8]|uniref:hypothetical protein n=1 Tax=Blastococcus sp. TF02-8 TaxID=2250574 RepID=UPI000DE99341|nr:hypothetical protein [Blastococcus sp. TF02-8]RBY95614.1 hypothetical protein DQ237_13930 [Blastococcus sp. TF02-8]